MPEPTSCSIPECARPKKSRGWCRAHYLRWYRYGDPLAGRGSVAHAELGTCSVVGCESPRDSHGYCAAHYQRWTKHGDPGTEPIQPRRPGLTCAMGDCDRKHYAKGLCQKHWQRLYKYGDPTTVLPGAWRGDDVGYSAVHERLNRSRGPANTFACAHCGQTARDWAYDHLDLDQKLGQRHGYVLAYSTDPDRYLPLCKACHSRFDENWPSSYGTAASEAVIEEVT